MRARRGHHVAAGHHGGSSARWRRTAAVTAAAVLPLAVCAATTPPASAAGGYTVTATIGVGGGPDGVAVDPVAHAAYVTNINDDTVSVIGETSATVTGTIGVGGGPFAVAVDPAAHTAYVANGGNGTVSVIDETTGTVTGTIAVGAGPDGVAVDPAAHTAYVANGGNGTVSVIDETTGTVTGTIAVGADPSAVAVDPTAHTAYVTNLAGTVSVIDEATGTVAATVPVGSDPDGVAVDPTSHTAYVANENASSVSVISGARPAPVTMVTSSRNPSTFGRNVTFIATVGPADGGTVTFSRGSNALCRAVSLTRVSGLTYRATCTTGALPAGRNAITAAYPGDASYASSTGLLTQTVTQAPTALTARIRLSRPLALTLTATLAASGRPLSAQPVSFSTGYTPLCTSHTSTLGVATCVLTGPQAVAAERDHDPIGARYPGSTSYRPSSATLALPPFL
jgi:YVTN family beta-propeller protein